MKKLYILAAGLFAGAVMHAQSNPVLQVDIDFSNAICGVGGCTNLTASYSQINQTTGYTVQSTPFWTMFPTTGGTLVNATADDVWSPLVNLPFNFSFYGSTYNQILVGSNGVITFDVATFNNGAGCPWAFSAALPNTNFPIKNAIYGVYQDTDISVSAINDDNIPNSIQNVNYYVLDTGINAAPNRVFVANFNELPQFQCHATAGTQTTQIILHEGSNIIDVLVYKRTPCTGWNGGAGVIGIQNAAGTSAVVPAGRNTGTWSATNEAWRFTPNGAAVPATLSWLANGNPIGHANPIAVCADEATNYTALVTYEGVGTASAQLDLMPMVYNLAEPEDLILCTNEPGPYQSDLTVNTALVIAAENADDFEVTYFHSAEDAENWSNPIVGAAVYPHAGTETIYMRIENIQTACYAVKEFQLAVNPVPTAPTGDADQTFTSGQTLANLTVTGQNIQWYATATSTEVLPASTPLVNGLTYFASQTIGDCEGRALPNRLAVTVSQVLSRDAFVQQAFLLFPNPAAQTVNVSAQHALTSVSIHNMLGQQVFEKKVSGHEATLDLSSLETGSYLVKVTAGGATTSGRLLKK